MTSLLTICRALFWVVPLCLFVRSETGEGVSLETPYVSSSLRRVENFVLTTGDEHSSDEMLGLIEWRERVVEGGRVLERDVFFAETDLAVRHVERSTVKTQRLVWREAATGIGRSQIVEPHEGDLLVVDWLRSGLKRQELEYKPGMFFPLALLEVLRKDERLPDQVSRYWPLTRSVEELKIESSLLGRASGIVRRLVELRRKDHTIAGRFLFDGQELEAFQWQEGGPWARRITRQRYQKLQARFADRGSPEGSRGAPSTGEF